MLASFTEGNAALHGSTLAHKLEFRLMHACHGASDRLNSCTEGACETTGLL